MGGEITNADSHCVPVTTVHEIVTIQNAGNLLNSLGDQESHNSCTELTELLVVSEGSQLSELLIDLREVAVTIEIKIFFVREH